MAIEECDGLFKVNSFKSVHTLHIRIQQQEVDMDQTMNTISLSQRGVIDMHTSTLLALVAVIVQCTWQLTESETVRVIRAERSFEAEGSGESSGEGSEKPEEGSGEGSGDVDVATTSEGSGGEASGENIENNAVTDKPTLLAFF
ncbi:unnamed protein product [Angiostrongylus costaricensis]|uniref:Uncharacterized protein n=1 Tax=Angiostrongylus costaricensis TaxID=334426 RepID=A0A158PIC9_ANGCS|nr:unnamed protein product [Angiostrongylus costaricensis]